MNNKRWPDACDYEGAPSLLSVAQNTHPQHYTEHTPSVHLADVVGIGFGEIPDSVIDHIRWV